MVQTTEAIPLARDNDGVIRIATTRVTLDTVVSAFNQGATAEEITQRYSTLDLADVYFAIGYYLRHQEEVKAYLQQRQEIAVQIRVLNEQRNEQAGLRERLLARRSSKTTQ
jgi:uncharacterized protein (DUF433 family)